MAPMNDNIPREFEPPVPAMRPSVTALVGNPKPASRTAAAARALATLIGRDRRVPLVDMIDLGDQMPSLPPEYRWSWPTTLVERAIGSHDLVVASPTYKGSFTGLLKSYLDHIPAGALRGTTAHILMVGASERHASAGDADLRRTLGELGAAVPAPALYVLEGQLAEEGWADNWWSQWSWASCSNS